MSLNFNRKDIAFFKRLIDARNKKLAQWKTFTDSNQILRCALSEMPTEECLQMGNKCCNCRQYKPAEFITIDSQKVYYHTIEKYLNDLNK